MARNVAIILFVFFSSTLFSQTSADSVSLSTDSVVYVYDTVYNTNTVQKIIFNEPLYYNVAGIKAGVGECWIQSQNHTNPNKTNYSELFCSFSRNRFLFSTGFGINSITETVKYATQKLNITSSTYNKLDTIEKYGQVIGKDTSYTFITKMNQYSKIDTQKVTTNHNIKTLMSDKSTKTFNTIITRLIFNAIQSLNFHYSKVSSPKTENIAVDIHGFSANLYLDFLKT